MIVKLFSVKDCVSGHFLAPNTFPNVDVFKRALSSAVNGPAGSLVHDYPGDCQAFEICSFDDETGEITCASPTFLFNCQELVLPEVKND